MRASEHEDTEMHHFIRNPVNPAIKQAVNHQVLNHQQQKWKPYQVAANPGEEVLPQTKWQYQEQSQLCVLPGRRPIMV